MSSSPDNRESRRSKSTEKAFESSKIACVDILTEGAPVRPVAESVDIMLRVAANHGNKSEEEKREYQDDLAS
jgi:hypothetical protein